MALQSLELAAGPLRALRSPRTLLFWGSSAAIIVFAFFIPDILPWADKYPAAWVAPFRPWTSDFMEWLVKRFDLGLFTFQELTRSIAWLLNWPFQFVNWLLWKGFPIGDEFRIPPITWVGLLFAVTVVGWRTGGWRLAAIVGACFGYLVLFGRWESSMMTLASILMSVPLGCVIGLTLGIWAYRSRTADRILTPTFDFMQTVPVFAYLLPVLFLFGFGPISATIATIIYAMPPMARATTLGLKTVSPEIIEFGRMAGCSPRQLMWKVMIPSAKPLLMVGVNQVIMLSLNAVIIASLIGAGGLGFDVLRALRSLKIGQGLEAGIAIVMLAIALDRLSQAFAAKQPPTHQEGKRSLWRRHPYLLAAVAVIVGTMAASYALPWLQQLPKEATITTAPFWDKLVSWVNINLFVYFDAFKTFLILNILLPFKKFMITIPWLVAVALVTILGWRLGGFRVAATVFVLSLLIAVSGFWEKAMITVYLIGISTTLSMMIGLPLGVWAAANRRVSRIMNLLADTLQTLPSFVYLIPVVMLFQVGDVPAIIAVVAYAVAPAIRYTDNGLRKVPQHLIEAARVSGRTRWQTLWKVKVPIAIPEIMLGVNQTIMMAISMLVITALVGTSDLGQEVFIGLGRADTGRGVVAGICIAFLSIISDRLIQAWARARKERLGIT